MFESVCDLLCYIVFVSIVDNIEFYDIWGTRRLIMFDTYVKRFKVNISIPFFCLLSDVVDHKSEG